MSDLTPRQRDVYRAILTAFATYGSAPTIRELCSDLDISSPNGIVQHLTALHAKGVIVWHRDRSSRGIEVPTLAAELKARAGAMLAEAKGGA